MRLGRLPRYDPCAALDELREDLEDVLNGEYRRMLKEDIVAELRGNE